MFVYNNYKNEAINTIGFLELPSEVRSCYNINLPYIGSNTTAEVVEETTYNIFKQNSESIAIHIKKNSTISNK